MHYERYDRGKLRSVEYLQKFAEEDSIQLKSYNRGGDRKTQE